MLSLMSRYSKLSKPSNASSSTWKLNLQFYTGIKRHHDCVGFYLSHNIHAEVETLQVCHAQECAREDLQDQIPAQIQVFQRSQRAEVNFSHGLKISLMR